jgi:hypothetical protein
MYLFALRQLAGCGLEEAVFQKTFQGASWGYRVLLAWHVLITSFKPRYPGRGFARLLEVSSSDREVTLKHISVK